MKSLLKYLKHYKKETALAPLFKMLEAIFDLLVPLVVAAIIDNGIGKSDVAYTLKMGGVLILLAVVGLLLALTAQFFAAKAAAGFGTELRHDLFAHIQSLSYSQFDRNGTATFITRMTTDVNQVQAQVNMAIRLLLRSPFIVFGAMIMAFTVDTKTAWVFVIAIPVLSVIVYGVMLITIPMYKKVQSGLDKIMVSTRENLSGVRVIRAFNKQESERKRYAEENQFLYKMQMLAGRISTIMNPATYVIVNIAIIGILWVGGKQVYIGKLTQGQVVALVNYMSQILIELIKLAGLIINLIRAFACASRIEEVFRLEPDMQEGTYDGRKQGIQQDAENPPAVEFEQVSVVYNESGEDAITDVNLKVLRGQTIGIIGGTGSGKTTLVHLIPRFYDAARGVVKINGVNVREYTFESLRRIVGIVPQKAQLFAGTIRSNLLWGNKNARERELVEALKLSQSYDFVMDKEQGLDTVVEQNGQNFSGGQRQRLTIARALVQKPEILILDDSSSALDYATDAKLRMALKTLKDTTTFIVAQRAASIMHADQIVVFDDGNIAGIGTHQQLLETCEVYQEIYESQFKTSGEGR